MIKELADTSQAFQARISQVSLMGRGAFAVLALMPQCVEESNTRHIDASAMHIEIASAKLAGASTDAATPSALLFGFLSSLYDVSHRDSLAEEDKVRQGSLLVVKHLDGLLRRGKFSDVDNVFLMADTSRLHPEIAFSFLPITATARTVLDKNIRNRFVASAKSRLMISRSEAYVEKLLARYK